MPTPSVYVLPNSSTQRCLDRFSILDLDEDAEGKVPFWPLLVETLKQPVTTAVQLVDVLDTVSNILRASSGDAGDYGTLRAEVQRIEPKFFQDLWPKIVREALLMPEYFPSGSIPVLQSGGKVEMSRGHAACLVAHQFLCSLQCPPWRDGYFDFSIWYKSDQRHPAAVEMYLAAFFHYFDTLEGPLGSLENTTTGSDGSEGAIVYSHQVLDAHKLSPISEWSKFERSLLKIMQVEHYSTQLQEFTYQGSHGAVVVSANKHIGFGQSATQEELFVGNAPEACPAILFTPPLEDSQVLVVEGARPMLRISGQRRDVTWEHLDTAARRGGRMLFMDALEIDEMESSEGLPDLAPENIDREIAKSFTAFSSWDATRGVVCSGLWGCGAFNGDPAVKMTALWVAASLAKKELQIICDPLHGAFADNFARFVEQVPSSWTARDLRVLLSRIPRETKRLSTMDSLLSMIQKL